MLCKKVILSETSFNFAFFFATPNASLEISVAIIFASEIYFAREIAMFPDPVPMSSIVGSGK